MKIYLGKSFSLNFRHRFDSDGMFEIQARKSLSVKVVFLVIACLRELNLTKRSRFFIMYKIKGFRERRVCVVCTFLNNFMFVDQLLLMDVRS